MYVSGSAVRDLDLDGPGVNGRLGVFFKCQGTNEGMVGPFFSNLKGQAMKHLTKTANAPSTIRDIRIHET